MTQLDDVLTVLKKMQEDMGVMTNRIGALETGGDNSGVAQGAKKEPGVLPEENTTTSIVREKQLTKTFGIDTSSEALLEFLDHYKLCVEMNQQRRAPGWGDAKYRAKELR